MIGWWVWGGDICLENLSVSDFVCVFDFDDGNVGVFGGEDFWFDIDLGIVVEFKSCVG